jgi:Ca2+-binding RTX toxin-like protein
MFKPEMRRCATVIALTSLLTGGIVAGSAANTSHAGWPTINGDLMMHRQDESGEIRPTKTDKHNELLGGHGNDTIYAGGAGDVIWGDYKPSGQPASQQDVLNGGSGKDFIYASHGVNQISTGGGADRVHAHFGSGSITCTSSNAKVYLSHKSRKRYTLHGCKRISYKTVGY